MPLEKSDHILIQIIIIRDTSVAIVKVTENAVTIIQKLILRDYKDTVKVKTGINS